jgi:hypothetical protein
MNAVLTVALAALAGATLLAQRPALSEVAPAREGAAALPQMHSLLVSHRGRLIFEYYAPPYGR